MWRGSLIYYSPHIISLPQAPAPTSSQSVSPGFFLQQRTEGSSPLLPTAWEPARAPAFEVWSCETPPSSDCVIEWDALEVHLT